MGIVRCLVNNQEITIDEMGIKTIKPYSLKWMLDDERHEYNACQAWDKNGMRWGD